MSGIRNPPRSRRSDADEAARLFRLIDELPVLVAHLDRGYRICFANHGYREWFGLDPASQEGRHVREVIGQEAFALLQPTFDKALAGHRAVFHGEVPYARGGKRFIHGTYNPSRDETNTLDGIYILAVDLSEQENLRHQLDVETQRSRTVIENAIDGILTIDREEVVQSANPAIEAIFGFEAGEIIGQPLTMLMPEEEARRHNRYIGRYLRTRDPRIIDTIREVEGVHRDGGRIPLELAVTEIRDNGESHFVGFVRDVSDRKRAEQEAHEHLSELAHVSRVNAMGELSANLAHEISQPLTAIHATAEACIAMLDSGRLDRERLLRALEQTSAQAQRAGEVVEQIRAFVRKGQPGSLSWQDPGTLIRNVLTLLSRDLENAGIRVESELPNPLCRCEINSIQIEQVIFNLVRNAIDAMSRSDGDRVLRVTSCPTELPGYCRISVMDSGPGIAEGDLDRIFQPFFTTKPRGMGQGLSICRSIIEAHGGRLGVANGPTGGAIFSFTLPANTGGQ